MNPKDLAALNRVPLHLLPDAGVIEGSLACRDGAIKYGKLNWREKPISLHAYIGAMRRHLAAYADGEDYASDSGVHHLGHVIATASIILDAKLAGTLIDDRVPLQHGASQEFDLVKLALEAGFKPNEYRAWSLEEKIVTEDGCHEWQGRRNAAGYGVLYINDTCHQAHRMSYRICVADIPKGHVIRHTCDNPCCVNPDHLITGTPSENSLDMVVRRRSTRGRGTIDLDTQIEIAKRRIAGERGVDLAEEYGVTPQDVWGYKIFWEKFGDAIEKHELEKVNETRVDGNGSGTKDGPAKPARRSAAKGNRKSAGKSRGS